MIFFSKEEKGKAGGEDCQVAVFSSRESQKGIEAKA
jgi:hypothetical protein